MSALIEVMDRLDRRLPLAGEVKAFQDLEEVICALQEELGHGVRLQSLDDGSVESLSDAQRRLFETIVYLQGAWMLLSDIASDGVYSIFYKCTGEEIELCRAALRRGDEPLLELFEEAYSLVAGQLDIVPDANIIARRPEESPYDLVDRETLARLDDIENRIEAQRMEAIERLIACYHRARFTRPA
ncbi:MAG TPA: hypothetical protein VKC56_05500 [Gallionellaceae bacterium]|nr:hypothetical protein [Gallionellaceae bacterium]